MAERKRTAFQIERDREEATRLYLRGLTQAQIAERLGVSRQQVTYDIRVIQARWRKETARDLDEDKARELAKIDELERTYWDAWESSLQEKEIKSTRQTNNASGARSEAAIRKEMRDGNATFLSGVHWCIERRCKLLGLDAPVKTELGGTDGKPLVVEVHYGARPRKG